MEVENVDARIEWEAKRVAAAFGVTTWGAFGIVGEEVLEVSEEDSEGWYSGDEPLSGSAVTWCIDEGVLREISVYNQAEDGSLAILKLFRGYGGRFKEWRLQVERGGHELMARGLYRLGFEDDHVLCQLPQLSAHEKMELRLSLPREFWPKKWLNEEEAK